MTGILITSNGATAIIKGKCYSVHDRVEGGTITAIKKGGVTVLINGETWEFPVSGEGTSLSKKGSKTGFAGFMARTKKKIEGFSKKSK